MDFFYAVRIQLGNIKELFHSYLYECSQYENIYLFGAGRYGIRFAELLLEQKLRPDQLLFVDNDSKKQGTEIVRGIRCIGRGGIRDTDQALIILTSPDWVSEMCRTLGADLRCCVDIDMIRLLVQIEQIENILEHESQYIELLQRLEESCSKEIIWRQLFCRAYGYRSMADLTSFPEYFIDDIRSRLSEKEVFLDGGAFTGDTLEAFRKTTGDRFEAIYSFEMDADNYKQLQNNPACQDSRIKLFPYGLGDKERIVSYAKRGNVASSYAKDVAEAYTDTAVLKSVDQMMLEGEMKMAPTLVKLDIEGAEMDALHGMEKMLLTARPKLVVCIYHLANDLWEIPLYLMNLLPNYRFFVRQHSWRLTDTVLYAV